MTERIGLAGRIARYFLRSKMTPALVVAICALGLLAIAGTPRQENPQITMPAAVIVTQYPGATASEVQRLVTERGERVLQEVPGIEHIYAVSQQNVSILTVLFHVGDDPTRSFVALYDQVFAHLNELPPGASQPQITPLSVDDIPIAVLTLHGRNYNRGQLYAAAERLIAAIQPIDGLSSITTYGGRPRQVSVTLDPVRLAAYGLSPLTIARAIGANDLIAPIGSLRGAAEIPLHAGTPFTDARQAGGQIVAVSGGAPVRLDQVATVALEWTPEEEQTRFGSEPAVSIAIAKKPGTNAVEIARRIHAAAGAAQLPPGIGVTFTRDDGAKANRAVNELIERLIEAIVIVVILLLVLGWRQALVVATAIPLTLFVTLGIGMLAHQTINRITLFALILSLGLLVDDAIVMVENIHRHYAAEPEAPKVETTIRAVTEIGSPTSLATLTVILSFLPMLFVTGMMGPYMRPIPLNVPVAMLTSLFIAFAITPWATYHLLHRHPLESRHAHPGWVAPFTRALRALLEHRARGDAVLVGLGCAFVLAIALPALTLVQFRMLPRANETTFLVSIDAPPASTVAQTTRIAEAVGTALGSVPEVADYEIFAGTNSIPDLSSLLEGTVFRTAPNQSDIRVNLVPKDERKTESALLVRRLRGRLQAVAATYGATLRILQTPPGPPVRNTILAKIYGPDSEVRRAISARLTAFFGRERGVVDIDPSTKGLPVGLQLEVDQRKAALAGVDVNAVAQTLAIALHGASAATLHTPEDPRPVGIFLRFAPEYRADAGALGSVMLPAAGGGLVPLSSIANVVASPVQAPLYRDDFEDVTYVGAEMAGRSSTYAVIDAALDLWRHPLPSGYRVVWDGEWLLTNTVFADLGRAMGIAFLLIYFVLVARFKSFRTPLVVLAAVPLAMIGIMPGFALLAPFGVYFSATAMIGLIALIGIVVRNSIILIEFVEDKLAEGLPLREALVESASARARPIFLTAAAGVLSSVVIAFDPVWSGLAWALVFGMSASALLSIIAIPLLYERIGERVSVPPALAAAAAVLAFMIAAPPAARADGTALQPLSLADATAIALHHNPAYLESAADVDAAQAGLRAARGPQAPSLALSDAYQVADPVAKLQTPFGALPFSPNGTNVPLATLHYTLFDGGLTAARIGAADARFAAARDGQREAAAATIGRVADAYYALAGAIGSEEVAERSVTVIGGHVTLVRQRLEAGVAARADLLQVQTELADARVKAIDARNAAERASNALDAALGVPLDVRYRPSDPLATTMQAPSLGGMLAAARANRGELSASREAILAARAAVDAAKAARLPHVGVAVSEGNVQPAIEPGFHGQFAVALNAVWTLFDNGVTAGNVGAAEAALRRARLEVERLQTEIELEVHQSYADVEAALERVDAAQALTGSAAENLRLAELRYRGGVGTVLELRDAELQESSARQTMVGAQAGLRRSLAALRAAAGLE